MSTSSTTQATDFEFSFHLPTLIEFGFGKASHLGERLLQLGVNKVFLVSDRGVETAGLLDNMTESMQEAKIHYDFYLEVEPDPGLETIDKGAEIFKANAYDCIVAVGGGSAIDTAKGIRVVASKGGSIGDYAGVDKIDKALSIPLVAIPTTSGTGSEVTIFGVYSDWDKNVKVTVTSQHMAPTIAFVDPALTMKLPPKMTAASGIDALAHGIETYFSLRSRPASASLAIEAIATVSSHLIRAVHNSEDEEARIGMSHGSLLAGMAFNNGFLGLTHAIGSALSGHCHVPHGVAIGLLLPHVVEFNAVTRPDKAAKIAELLGVNESQEDQLARQAAFAVAKLVKDIGLPTQLREVNVPETKLTDIARDSFKSGMMKFNPRQPSEAEVLELLKRVY
ncbi:iron-containing alcohol dehydrogenase [Peribacillus cavernae]|uniref:Iron-containing alcohol dehydrogenase n=1 Tax=Peribacillus cavernae TaxID=1674310 RepID=A0A3S1B933_9BACI|nr:iron-containing alcohol dehydrogenase [Peribacillus cavernae]MDQ0218714.1 alcohol dehydrogenase [Peribacillus cavernae]RUQ30930.1 iron-containing alcohol dehydrogenase [Peribacillus cavernae]